ncbi:hypothetical protein SASPL_105193 [Salvia splendens]|uniref:Uncharacterized protein n=1 Tax=Salvia splendens TaxID=180675 RepID=A0A8X8YKM1_SALSN|nr:hypothetical protein SASPL_105193 [Salvia splendens]
MDATREELPDTMAVFRLSGMEIRDLIMELKTYVGKKGSEWDIGFSARGVKIPHILRGRKHWNRSALTTNRSISSLTYTGRCPSGTPPEEERFRSDSDLSSHYCDESPTLDNLLMSFLGVALMEEIWEWNWRKIGNGIGVLETTRKHYSPSSTPLLSVFLQDSASSFVYAAFGLLSAAEFMLWIRRRLIEEDAAAVVGFPPGFRLLLRLRRFRIALSR